MLALLLYLQQDKQPLAAEGSSLAAESTQEEQSSSADTNSEEQPKRQKEQVQKILANVRQNFGKIYVAPEFTEEDLVPVEMPDLDVSDFSGSDGGEEEEEEEDAADGETADDEVTKSKPAAAATDPGKVASQKSSRQVIRDLDEKISKYKQFLERAKSKHFSAIRFVTPKPLNRPSFVYRLIALIAGLRAKPLHAGQTLSP